MKVLIIKPIRFYCSLLLFGMVVIGLGVLCVYGLRLWHESTVPRQIQSQEHLKEVVASLKQGMTKAEVMRAMDEKQWTSFSEENGEIRLWTTPQPLPTNWIVRLIFLDGTLTSVKFGTADNIYERPNNAPPDLWQSTTLNKGSN